MTQDKIKTELDRYRDLLLRSKMNIETITKELGDIPEDNELHKELTELQKLATDYELELLKSIDELQELLGHEDKT